MPKGLARVLATLGLVVLLGCGLTAASSAEPAGHFLDDKPLVVDVSVGKRVGVPVLNSSASRLELSLAVIGPAAAFFEPSSARKTVAPGLGVLRLTLTADARPTTGTLVLTAGDGTLERLPVQLVGYGGALGDALVPGSFDQVTMQAISRVPSVVRPVPGLMGWAIVLVCAGVLALVSAGTYGRNRSSRPDLAGFFAVLVVGGVVAFFVSVAYVGTRLAHELADGSAVPSATKTLAPRGDGDVVGTIVGDSGDEGRLTVDGERLTVDGVDRAGTYAGTVDALPDQSGGEVKLLLKVRDHWLYAAGVIAVGVLIGYLVSFFYANRRVVAQARVTSASLRARVAALESDWHLLTAGRRWESAYVLETPANSWIAAAEIQSADDPAAAQTSLIAVGTLATSFDTLRRQVDGLAQRAETMRHELGGDHLPEAAWLAGVMAPLDLSAEDPATTTVVSDRKGLVKEAAEADVRAGQLAQRWLSAGVRLRKLGANGHDVDQLTREWEPLRRSLLESPDTEAMKAVTTSLDVLRRQIDELDEQGPPPAVPAPPVAREYAASDDPAELRLIRKLLEVAAPALARMTSVFGESSSATVDRDDLANVTVAVDVPSTGADVQWVFSDGSRSRTYHVAGSGVQSTSHHFGRGAGTQVWAELVDAASLRPLGRWTGQLSSAGRHEQRRNALASDDFGVKILVFLLAVGSGLVALYLPNQAWGSGAAYVTALLWGAVTAEGVKAAVNLATNKWPIQ